MPTPMATMARTRHTSVRRFGMRALPAGAGDGAIVPPRPRARKPPRWTAGPRTATMAAEEGAPLTEEEWLTATDSAVSSHFVYWTLRASYRSALSIILDHQIIGYFAPLFGSYPGQRRQNYSVGQPVRTDLDGLGKAGRGTRHGTRPGIETSASRR
jgi:hypothetical protein